MRCGPLTCNRYADCHATITVQTNITSLNCRCLPGFKGGGIGINSCVPITLDGKCFYTFSYFSYERFGIIIQPHLNLCIFGLYSISKMVKTVGRKRATTTLKDLPEVLGSEETFVMNILIAFLMNIRRCLDANARRDMRGTVMNVKFKKVFLLNKHSNVGVF